MSANWPHQERGKQDLKLARIQGAKTILVASGDDLITKVGECTIAVPMPAKPRLKWSDEAERAELVRNGLEEAKGSWPEKCLQRAFVDGAKWWEFQRTRAAMWQEDQGKAEQAAIDKYGIDPVVVPSQIGADVFQLQSEGRANRPAEDGFDIRSEGMLNGLFYRSCFDMES